MKQTQDKVMIFSVEKDYLTRAENIKRTQDVLSILFERDIPHKRLEGYYEGVKETSFLVSYYAFFFRYLALYEYDQESVLILDEDREAHLLNKETTESIGYWKEVEKTVALKQDVYTFDPTTGKYYICS